MKENKYVYTVSKKACQVVNTTSNIEQLKKHIEIKGQPGDDIIYLQVHYDPKLATFATDEQIGANFIDEALTSAIVAGVSVDTAISRLETAEKVSVIDTKAFIKDKKPVKITK